MNFDDFHTLGEMLYKRLTKNNPSANKNDPTILRALRSEGRPRPTLASAALPTVSQSVGSVRRIAAFFFFF